MNLYCIYYERSRTHLSLDKDTPIPSPVTKSSDGVIVSIPRSAVCIIGTNGARPEPRQRRQLDAHSLVRWHLPGIVRLKRPALDHH